MPANTNMKIIRLRKVNGQYNGSKRLDTQIIVGLLVATCALTLIGRLMMPHTAIASPVTHSVAYSSSTIDLTDTETKQKVYELARDGKLTWYTQKDYDNEKEVAEFKNQFPEFRAGTINTVVRVSKQRGYKDVAHLLKLASCESHGDNLALNARGNSPKESIDRGLFQINDFWFKSVSNAQAFDVEASTNIALDKIMAGHEGLWVCSKKIK